MGKNKKKVICFVILSRANYNSIKSVMYEVKKSKSLDLNLSLELQQLLINMDQYLI